jgi:hypothetical protein
MRKAKFELRDAGLVEIKASFGGPFGRTTSAPKPGVANTVLASSEAELYEPFKNWVYEEFTPTDFVKGRDLFEVIVSGNRRPKDTKVWEIPDIISVSLKKYRYVPEMEFKTISFELKPQGSAFGTYGIFEAISHSKFGSQTYYCFEWPNEKDFYDHKDYQRIEQEAKTHGIGLIQVWFTDQDKTFLTGQVILEAKETSYDPATLSSFIERFFPEEVKNRLMHMTQSW